MLMKKPSQKKASQKRSHGGETKQGKNKKNKKKRIAPQNNLVTAPIFPMDQASDAIAKLKNGIEEAVIIDAAFATNSFDGNTMVKYWNARVKAEHRVDAPTSAEDLIANKKKYTGLPGINGGMWHAYATSVHDSAIDSPAIDQIFTEITGTPDWEIHPNRMRFNLKDNDDGWKQAHLEGEHVMKETSDIGCIVCLTAGRTFTYYAGSNNDPDARDLYRKYGGPKSRFISLKPKDMTKWRRTTITTTKPGQIILFAGSVIHEISKLNTSLSLFLSPFDPATETDEVTFYEDIVYQPPTGMAESAEQAKINSKALDKARAQANKLKKNNPGAPPIPSRFRLPGKIRKDPTEFAGLSRKQCDLFGTLFHGPGYVWPSGKETFPMMHMMAFNTFAPKMLSFMFTKAWDIDKDKNSEKVGQFTLQDKFNYEVITRELVEGCQEFDMSYFDDLPFQNISAEEIEAMKMKYNGVPEVAWPLIQYWVKDIRKCSPNVCKRRGYIV
jgi:hypothetical protein